MCTRLPSKAEMAAEDAAAAEAAAALMQRKLELEGRLAQLERQLDEVSLPSTRRGRLAVAR